MKHLYAAGETSCNGVHGANRLASNSLLESLVFAKRAAYAIAGETGSRTEEIQAWNWESLERDYKICKKDYEDEKEYFRLLKTSILDEIEKENREVEENESNHNQAKCG